MRTLPLFIGLSLLAVSAKAQVQIKDGNATTQNAPASSASKGTEALSKACIEDEYGNCIPPPICECTYPCWCADPPPCPPYAFIWEGYSQSYTSAEQGILMEQYGTVTIASWANVTLDVNPGGYVSLDPGAGFYFISEPTGNGVFIAMAEVGCGPLYPGDAKGTPTPPVADGKEEVITPLEEALLKGFALAQNVPNPFTQSTEIAAQLPETVREASLLIQNLQGVTLQTYPITQRAKVTVTVRGGSLQAGVYVYSLIADGQVIDTKKMILTD